jgi:hypothetical protein
MASGAFASMATVSGADHRDSPLNVANPHADINDVYAFRSPENNSNVAVAISVNPLIAPSDNNSRGRFDPSVAYQVHIDRNGDLNDEATANIRINSAADQLIIEGLGSPIMAPITPPGAAPIVTNAGGIKIFAGLRDDPFFFDLAGFQAFIANPTKLPARGLRFNEGGAPVDTFAGTNILAIVLEVPITAVTGGTSANSGTVRAWASTTKNGMRIDRMAIPTINTVLVPTGAKDAFNDRNPVEDAANSRETAIATIQTLRDAFDALVPQAEQDGGPLGNLSATQVGNALLPDVVTINFANPVQFPNGRRLQDDVIDAALGVVLNRGGAAGVSDGVNANDRSFSSSFPYLADPHAAAGGGSTVSTTAPASPAPVRLPNTGDGGLMTDSERMWSLSAGFFILALAFGGAGAYRALRARR